MNRPSTEPTPALHRCNLCGGGAEVVLAGRPTIVQCNRCGIASLAEFPARPEREAGYQENYYREETGSRFLGLFELAVYFFRWLRARSILRRVAGPARILDVGCGRGVLLEILQKRGWRVVGTQLSRTAAEAARGRRGVEVICGELTDLDVEQSSFQVITFFHVLEHLEQPARYLDKAHELLADGGLLLVEVPDFASPGFRVLGLRNLCVDYPNHLVFFTPATLRGLLQKSDFRVEAVRHFSLEYSPFTTLQNLLNLLPGEPNRFYRALMTNDDGRRLRRSPWTWLHALLASLLALPALLLSLSSLLLPVGNTLRCYCRKVPEKGRGGQSQRTLS